jgi:type VI secretion system secreted protein VgrG
VNDCIEIKAKQKIVLQAGQSAITLEGGDITFACPGKFSVKGGKHFFDSGASKTGEADRLPSRLVAATPPEQTAETAVPVYDEQIVYKDIHGEAIAAMPARVANKADDTQRLIDKSPADGALDRLNTEAAQPLEYALEYAEFKIKK